VGPLLDNKEDMYRRLASVGVKTVVLFKFTVVNVGELVNRRTENKELRLYEVTIVRRCGMV
jgi:hypothetical protein